MGCTSCIHCSSIDSSWDFNSDYCVSTMKGFGYQLGKLLGTIVVTFHRTSKSALVLIVAVGIISLLIFSALTKPKRTTVEGTTLRIGGRARISYFTNVNIRQSPGHLNKPRHDIVVTVPSAAIVEIIGGPQQSDNLTWWLVRWGDWQGWMAEYTVGNRQILAPT